MGHIVQYTSLFVVFLLFFCFRIVLCFVNFGCVVHGCCSEFVWVFGFVFCVGVFTDLFLYGFVIVDSQIFYVVNYKCCIPLGM